MIIYGKNPVFEAISRSKVARVYIRKGTALYNVKFPVPVSILDKSEFDERFSRDAQGVAAEAEDILPQSFKGSLKGDAIILDRIQDPQNFGAIVRSAACFGVKNIIIPKYHQCPVTPAVIKASAGGIYHISIWEITNLKTACENLKEHGYTVAACDMQGKNISTFKPQDRVALIIGSEGKGVKENLKQTADIIISIPMKGGVGSLNASHTASIAMYKLFSEEK